VLSIVLTSLCCDNAIIPLRKMNHRHGLRMISLIEIKRVASVSAFQTLSRPHCPPLNFSTFFPFLTVDAVGSPVLQS